MTGSPARLAGAAIALLIVAAVIWQAGLLGAKNDATNPNLDLADADTGIETPPVDGFDVGLRPGDIAPDFEFSSFEGERLRLSDFRGRPVMINFWATWCQPCRQEMPAIDEAMRRFSADDVAVLAINRGERFSSANEWANELGVQFTAFGYDPDAAIFKQYRGTGMPTSYFIDARGVVTEIIAGPLRDTDLDFALQNAIDGFKAPIN